MTTWLIVILIAAVLLIGLVAALALVFVIWQTRSVKFEPVDGTTRTTPRAASQHEE